MELVKTKFEILLGDAVIEILVPDPMNIVDEIKLFAGNDLNSFFTKESRR